MKILDMDKGERPREKMLRQGAENMSDAELLAIILRTGKGGISALELSNRIISEAGGSDMISALSIDELLSRFSGLGIGPAKAVMLCASFELGRRSMTCSRKQMEEPVTDASQVFHRLAPRLSRLSHEECWVLYLNRANVVIAEEMISKGGLQATVFDTKAVVKKALDKKKATGLILVHNHPSGNPAPGNSDILVTKELKAALDLFGVSLYDHVIISHGRYFSFEKGRVVCDSF